MGPVVLDASALLASAFGEPGGQEVRALLEDPGARVSIGAANWAEFVQKCLQKSIPMDGARAELLEAGLRIVPVDAALAEAAAALWQTTRSRGLSLGDRLCLALGAQLGAPVWTTDRAWLEAGLAQQIHCIRPVRSVHEA